MAPIVEKLPDEPLFHHVFRAFTANPGHILLHDWVKGTQVSCTQLLTDMLCMRRQILQALPASMFDSRHRIVSERPFILVLAPGNYDFIVAAFSTLCCGAAFSPISSTLSPEEASYIIELTNASCMLVSPEFQLQASAIQQHQATQTNGRNPIAIISIAGNNNHPTPEYQVQIDPEMTMDPVSPGALIFTSGTTGPPKGIVRPRSALYNFPASFPHEKVALVFRPPNWSGVAMPLMWRVLSGTRTEVIENSAHELWERLKRGGVTHIKVHHDDTLPYEQREQYVKGARALQKPIVAGDFTWPTVKKFWQDLLGRPLINIYGLTEVGGVTAMTDECDSNLEGCIGKPRRRVQVKLSEGDHGEILVKSPVMFTHYLGNEAATRAAFDEEGYFRSGDFGCQVGDRYILKGRLSTDFIRYHGLWVPLQEVETRLAELPYVSDVYVVPADFNCARQIAALVRLVTPQAPVTLFKVRGDLQDRLQKYKLPTLLRILQDGEQVPETTSGKVARKEIAEKYFPLSVEGPLPPEVEFWDGKVEAVDGPRKAWDWAGMI